MNGNDLVYLRSNVIAEPLVAGWYAWPHLISPATCALNIVGRHLRIMNSYIQSPQLHAAAVKNPAMLGGPFIDYATNRAAEVKLMRDQTLTEQSLLISLAQAIQELTKLLKQEATGYSLDPLYEKVPAPLRGYVELFYDLQNHPSFRFYEAMLYRSPYYQPSSQSVELSIADTDARAFVLSTPRLPGEGTIEIKMPFDQSAYDDLFRMRRKPGSYATVRESLSIGNEQEPLFRSFFTESAPKVAERYQGEGLRVRYFGHACLVLETKDVCIISDPIVSQPYEGAMPRFTLEDLPEVIDYVVITHGHQDHILLETLLQLRAGIRNVVVPRSSSGELQDPSLKLILKAVGFPNVIELDEFEALELPGGGRLTGLPFLGEHADLHVHSKLCHHVALDGFSVMLAADSCAVERNVYEHVRDMIGAVDVLFLGMECDGAPLSWLYGPLLPEPVGRAQDQSRRLSGSDFPRALGVVECFRPKEVYVYAMGMEPWLNHISSLKYTDESLPMIESTRLVNECRTRGIISERLYGMKELIYPK